ncbi:MAG TPA: SDR family NAD(P)-dependent oxidoreductase, partial [Candidatus Nanoarchaeia archaeon]|nr:SDR family NAD(P)-dependent oxidoreductase [Candidatus Nanoarchaeia archaeon]
MEIDNFYKNKDILVTGGCGSIGREIVKHLLNFDVKKIRVFDQNEFGHHKLKNELKNYSNVDYVVGNVREYDSLKPSVRGVDIVFHTAALKHLPFCETDPIEAVKTNIIGTNNLIELSKQENVNKFIFISTDKTVYPTSAMAAT